MKLFITVMYLLSCLVLCSCSATEIVTRSEEEKITANEQSIEGREEIAEEGTVPEEITKEETVPEENREMFIDPSMSEMEQILAACEMAQLVEENQTVTVDGVVEFVLEKAYLAEDILPSNVDGPYNYIEGTEDTIYAVAQGKITNLGDEDIDLNTFTIHMSRPICASFLVGGTDYYMGSWATEDPDGSSISSVCGAGETAVLYIFAAIPKDAISDIGEIDGVLTAFHDFKEDVTDFFGALDWNACTHMYYIK